MSPEEVSKWWKIMDENIVMGDEGAETACWHVVDGKEGIGTITAKGYHALCNKGKNKFKFYAHRLSYAAAHGIDSLPIDRKSHVSHLCHNPRCVRPDHLVVESDLKNRSRNQCPYIINQTFFCQHDPCCIAAPPKPYGVSGDL